MKKKTILLSSLLLLNGCGTKIEDDIPATETTEHIIETYTQETTEEPRDLKIDITLSFIGDCIFAANHGDDADTLRFNYYAKTHDQSYFLQYAQPYIGTDDFTIANAENVFSDEPLQERYKGEDLAFWFKSSSVNAGIYKVSSVEAVTLANNHIKDYSDIGIEHTLNAFQTYSPDVKLGDDDHDIILEKDGVKIGLICCNLWGTQYVEPVLERIENLKNATDLQVVLFHGGTEKIHEPEYWKQDAAHQFVDAGADLVVGGHPHVLQPYEQYNGVDIVYSVGNFCYGGSLSPENRTIIFQETFTYDTGDGVLTERSKEFIPFYVFTGSSNNYQPKPIEVTDPNYDKILKFMNGEINSPV